MKFLCLWCLFLLSLSRFVGFVSDIFDEFTSQRLKVRFMESSFFFFRYSLIPPLELSERSLCCFLSLFALLRTQCTALCRKHTYSHKFTLQNVCDNGWVCAITVWYHNIAQINAGDVGRVCVCARCFSSQYSNFIVIYDLNVYPSVSKRSAYISLGSCLPFHALFKSFVVMCWNMLDMN